MESVRYRAGLWCGWGQSTSGPGLIAFNFALSSLRTALIAVPANARTTLNCYLTPTPTIARRASARPISTKAEVTSGPPTRMRVGVFILFHS
jgi:hypothetical protein